MIDPATGRRLDRNGNPNLLLGGVKGHDGSNAGSPPNKIRDTSRRTFEQVGEKIAPAMLAIADALSEVNSDDPATAKKAHETLHAYRNAGWTPDQLIKSWGKLADVGMPKQSEIVLGNPDVLNVVAECVGQVYGPGRVEECIALIALTLGEG